MKGLHMMASSKMDGVAAGLCRPLAQAGVPGVRMIFLKFVRLGKRNFFYPAEEQNTIHYQPSRNAPQNRHGQEQDDGRVRDVL